MRPLSRGGNSSRSARLGAVVLMLGLVISAGQGTAWADTSTADSKDGSVTHSESTTGTSAATEPKDSPAATESDSATGTLDTARESSSTVEAGFTDEGSTTSTDTSEPSDVESTPTELEQDSSSTATAVPAEPSTAPKATDSKKTVATDSSTSADLGLLRSTASPTTSEPDPSSKLTEPSSSPRAADIAPAARSLTTLIAPAAVATVSTPTIDIAPITPGPVAPIAEILELPGRIVNAVLQLVGITTAAGTGPSPVSPEPIADLFFAVFRRLEHAFGLDSPLSGQPVPPSLVYTGPLDTATPTVAQFLNAASAEYVLGGIPGGLSPFTVNGWPLTSTYVSTGETAQVWVTPQNQVIIAYSGTTGGTNLLVNPLIAISQLLADFQAGFTNTTPDAFAQALDFAQRVQMEAAIKGYAPDSVFVTGHSLGAWEAQYVAQQLGLSGIGFEGPGLSTTVPGNGADSLFVNTATYGDMAAYMSSDLPGLYPFVPYPYVPGGGLHPHYGPIVMLGDPNSSTPMTNAAALWGKGIVGSLIAVVDLLGNFFASHLPGVQAYNLDVVPDPGVVPWLGINGGPVNTGFADMTIPEFLKASSDAGILVAP